LSATFFPPIVTKKTDHTFPSILIKNTARKLDSQYQVGLSTHKLAQVTYYFIYSLSPKGGNKVNRRDKWAKEYNCTQTVHAHSFPSLFSQVGKYAYEGDSRSKIYCYL